MNQIQFWKEHNLKNFLNRGKTIYHDEINHDDELWLNENRIKKNN